MRGRRAGTGAGALLWCSGARASLMSLQRGEGRVMSGKGNQHDVGRRRKE